MVDEFPILNPLNWSIIGYKKRSSVHSEGDWHPALQTFIFRKNNNDKVEVLMQKRSSRVDIAKGFLDQSYATQLLKGEEKSLESALFRGARDELGLDLSKYRILRIFSETELSIVKTYSQANLYNRELLHLFFIEIPYSDSLNFSCCDKVELIEWIDWDDFTKNVENNYQNFTKTSRFYSVQKFLSEALKSRANFFLGIKKSQKGSYSPKSIRYYSWHEKSFDVALVEFEDYHLLEKYYLGEKISLQKTRKIENLSKEFIFNYLDVYSILD